MNVIMHSCVMNSVDQWKGHTWQQNIKVHFITKCMWTHLWQQGVKLPQDVGRIKGLRGGYALSILKTNSHLPSSHPKYHKLNTHRAWTTEVDHFNINITYIIKNAREKERWKSEEWGWSSHPPIHPPVPPVQFSSCPHLCPIFSLCFSIAFSAISLFANCT